MSSAVSLRSEIRLTPFKSICISAACITLAIVGCPGHIAARTTATYLNRRSISYGVLFNVRVAVSKLDSHGSLQGGRGEINLDLTALARCHESLCAR